MGRRWPWVDPLKDIQANKLAIEQGFKTRQQIISEQGGDFMDTVEALRYEQDILEQYGITIGEPNEDTNQPGSKQDSEALAEDGDTSGDQ